jgi:hypothetical protein
MTASRPEVPGQLGGRRTTSPLGQDVATTSLMDQGQRVTPWAGYLLFAAAMLVLIGLFDFVFGLVAIFKDSYFEVPSRNLVVNVDYTAWGWVHLVLGVVAVVTGVGILDGKLWARFVGVGYATISAVVNLASLKASPVWASLIIAFDVLVIWALCTHGSELE